MNSMNFEPSAIQSLKNAIARANTAVIVTHFSPDGDAIGSVASLEVQLKKMGKHVYSVMEEVPLKFAFLLSSTQFERTSV